MHSKSNYPAKKSESDLDVELKDNTEDKEYLDILKFNLANLNDENFDFVFYFSCNPFLTKWFSTVPYH